MLERICRRFEQRFEPGQDSRHRRRCAPCTRFAATVELVASLGARPQASSRLERRLREIARRPAGEQHPADSGLRARLGFDPSTRQLALPPRLEDRLIAIARVPAPRVPPRWLAQIRYSVAASLVLALLASNALAEPLGNALPSASALTRHATGLWLEVHSRGEQIWQSARFKVMARYHRTRDQTHHQLRTWFDSELDSPTPISPSAVPRGRRNGEKPPIGD